MLSTGLGGNQTNGWVALIFALVTLWLHWQTGQLFRSRIRTHFAVAAQSIRRVPMLVTGSGQRWNYSGRVGQFGETGRIGIPFLNCNWVSRNPCVGADAPQGLQMEMDFRMWVTVVAGVALIHYGVKGFAMLVVALS